MPDDSPYIFLRGLLAEFLHKYGLKDLYLKNLSESDNCIGCSRDGGDHDMECPIDAEWWFEGASGHATTNSPYEEQVAGLLPWIGVEPKS